MKTLLFCEQPYAVKILTPLEEECLRRGDEVLWYVCRRKVRSFPMAARRVTFSMRRVRDFAPDAIFAPCNIVPCFLRGVKVQIFHGYAGEKSSHFRIRGYFDLYLTQGPLFTERFRALAKIYGNFEVVETGWTKQDWIAQHRNDYSESREEMLREHGKTRMLLYAPTFNRRMTSLPYLMKPLEQLLADHPDTLLVVKLHDLTKRKWREAYRKWALSRTDTVWVEERDLTPYTLMSDHLLSDTSSAVYEFLLLDKPVITYGSTSRAVQWNNITDAESLSSVYGEVVRSDPFASERAGIIAAYDPYTSGGCSARMYDAVEDYIHRNGVPTHRQVPFKQRLKSFRFGY